MPSRPGIFLFGIFFSVVLSESSSIFNLGPSFIICKSFSMLLIHLTFCYDLSDPILCSKIVSLPSNLVAGISLHILSLVASRIFFLYFGMLCLVLFQYLFSLTSFTKTFCFISSSCIFYFNWVAFYSLSHHLIFSFCLIIFTCCRSFLIGVSSPIFHPSFDFLLVFFKEKPDFFTDYFGTCID